jgi:hypothetical protein
MKINDSSPQVEVSAQLEEQFFSIQDQGMIFDILRNKMYSNPILAICREISCNARDAHREAKKANDPIHIHIPNHHEPFFKVKDFGPGISPDRMSNIFIKYTASTKRNDNIQTGGFGLGAKTPFSYSDSFTIVTNYNGKQYNYACFIDETKIGKLTLLSESETNEVNGTEIIVPVKSKDFRAFEEYTEQATRYWDVHPVIKGGEIHYKENFPILKGDGWSICTTSDWSRSIKLIVDGVEYPCDVSSLRSYADSAIIDAARGNFLLYFGVGELSLSANREQIYLDTATKTTIANKISSVTKYIRESTQLSLNNCKNYWEANVYYRTALQQAFSNLSFLNKLAWKDKNLISGHPDIGCPIITFSKGKYSRRLGTDPNKISKSSANRSFNFSENCALYINDLGIKDLNVKHVRKGFDNDPSLNTIQVICPNEKTSLESLNNAFHLDEMDPIPLSSITKSISRNKKSSNNNRVVIFQYDKIIGNFRQTSYSSFENDLNKKVLCLLRREDFNKQKTIILKNGNTVSMNLMQEILQSNKDFSFYAVDNTISATRLEEDFSDCEDLEDFIDSIIMTHSYEYYVKLSYIHSHYREVDHTLLKNGNYFKQAINNKNSIFIKKLDCHSSIDSLLREDLRYLSIYRGFRNEIPDSDMIEWLRNNPSFDITKVDLAFHNTYPLLNTISSYSYSEYLPHIAQYVNLIDSSLS